jgi:hypothetical protein
MATLRFNPFGKDFELLEAKDLEKLREVSEGWHIEYKEKVPDNKSIAKSLSAFANHHGGWLFYGIEESHDNQKVAGAFPGIEIGKLDGKILQIQETAKAHVDPPPYYYIKKLTGPCDDIGLSQNRGIIVVLIPPGPDTPYISSDGKIYRRIAESSDPKPETDRSVIDLLYERSKQKKNDLINFLSFDEREEGRTIFSRRSDISCVHIFIMTDPFDNIGAKPIIGFGHFCNVMKSHVGKSVRVNVPLGNTFTAINSYVAQQVNNGKHLQSGIRWRYYYSKAISVVSIALRTIQIDDSPYVSIDSAIENRRDNLNSFLLNYNHKDRYLSTVGKENFRELSFLDINKLLLMLWAVLSKHRALLTQGNFFGPFFVKFKIKNVGGYTPFLDTNAFLRFIQEHGIPIIQDSNSYIPSGIGHDRFIEIPHREKITEENEMDTLNEQMLDVAMPFAILMTSFGIPVEVSADSVKEIILEAMRTLPKVSS